MSFYLLNKKVNQTSNDLVTELKKKLNISSIGHAGTLDPFATGLMILATDGEKKLLSKFLESRKTYIGKIYFGKTTDTLDPTGKIVEESEKEISKEDLIKVIKEKFSGKILQTPPNYSAIKINGKKAYQYARKNKDIKLEVREKEIYYFKIQEIERNLFSFKVIVSSGTYIRKLAYDIGQILNIPSMLVQLSRVKIGNISIEQAQDINDNLKTYDASDLLNINIVQLSDEYLKKLLEGKKISFFSKDKEVIFENDKMSILATNIDKNFYKIKKRLR